MKTLACMALIVVFAACADNSSPREDYREIASDTLSVDTTHTSNEDGGDTLTWTTSMVHLQRSVPEIAVVSDLRAGRHDEYVRFVVEFQNVVIPGYHVAFLDDDPIECGSGESLDIAGSAVLEIRLEPARGHNDRGESTVDHGKRTFDLPVLREADVSCDFEAVFSVLLGLSDRLPFRVSELRDPARLVVDVKHPSDQ